MKTATKDSPRTLIYVLLTEYVTSTRGVSQPFIAYEYHTPDTPFDNTAELQGIFSILDYFAYEHFIPIYDPPNLNGSIPPQEPQPQRPQLVSKKMALQTKMKRIGFAEPKDLKVTAAECHLNHNDVTHSILGHMLANQRLGHAVVLLHAGAFKRHDPIITLTYPHNGYTDTVTTVSSIKELHTWLSQNRKPQRRYTFNPKHGDFHKRARNGWAQLETTTADTTTLLYQAVGIDHDSPLWYYDHARGKYIYFENQRETPPNFHAYHVGEGENNYENIDIAKLRMVQDIP